MTIGSIRLIPALTSVAICFISLLVIIGCGDDDRKHQAPDSALVIEPFPDTSRYDAVVSSKYYESQLENNSKQIAKLNERYNQSNLRRKELENAITRGDQNSAAAKAELHSMDIDREQSKSEIDTLRVSLNNELEYYSSILTNVDRDNTELESKLSQSKISRSEYETDSMSLQVVKSDAVFRVRLCTDLLRRIVNGYVGSAKLRSHEQIQKDFFPTY